MSYQVLARKFRPQDFSEIVGQEHVVQALVNGLDNDRIHHAYLFTGTRGVGKTTLARVLAKALNCEKGVSGTPCNQCSHCEEIKKGEFLDLIEVDAASRTGVDDTRELLENVQYAPSKGRFKIYLIDEVHMFSKSSFNALLKTLEEPPDHVKFLLATTEQDKLPITILSRCLQFNLKRLTVSQITQQLEKILNIENVNYDASALGLIARAADGSMRDALSLLDQSLAFGDGKVVDNEVRIMLGAIEQKHVVELLSLIIKNDHQAVFKKITDLAQLSINYAQLLADLSQLVHEISLFKVFGQVSSEAYYELSLVKKYASELSDEQLQLYYQVINVGRNQLPMAPSLQTGFEMTMIRLIGFELFDVSKLKKKDNIPFITKDNVDSDFSTDAESKGDCEKKSTEPASRVFVELEKISAQSWPEVFQCLELKGIGRELARNVNVLDNLDRHIVFGLDSDAEVFLTKKAKQAVAESLNIENGDYTISFKVVENISTIATMQQASQTIQEHENRGQPVNPVVQALQENFGAQVIVEKNIK